MTPEKKRVVGYIRGSTEEQRNTLVAQRTQIEAYCAYKELDLIQCFVDEGESAFSISFYERPKAAEMMARMAELHVHAVVITKVDRGFRDTLDCLFTVDDFSKRGIGLHLLDLPGQDLSSPEGRMMLGVFALFAEFENRRRSQRQKAAFTVMRTANKLCGGVPYGWNVGSTMGKADGDSETILVPNPDEQRVLHRIVRWVEKDEESVSAIARCLNLEGIPTKNVGKPMKRKGKEWICDGRWSPATVASVYKHHRLAPVPMPRTLEGFVAKGRASLRIGQSFSRPELALKTPSIRRASGGVT